MKEISSEEQNNAASRARDVLATYKEAEDLINIGAYEEGSNKEIATYKEAEDLINIGAYEEGSNKEIDIAIKYIDKVNSYLKQGVNEVSEFDISKNELINMFN